MAPFKDASDNCIVFEYYNDEPKAPKEKKSTFIMCPTNNKEDMKNKFIENMDKSWKEQTLNITHDT